MINYLIIAAFILSIAITAGSILISSHLKSAYKADFFSTLLFYQVFYFTFGFYAIWGQVFVNYYLTSFVSSDVRSKIIDVMVFIGIPFIVFASLMLIRFAREITNRITGNFFVLLYIFINLLLILSLGFLLYKYPQFKAQQIIRYYFIVYSLFYTAYCIYMLMPGKNKRAKLKHTDLQNIYFLLGVILIIQNLLLLYSSNKVLALAFIFFYYINGGFLSILIKYKADLSKLLPENEKSKSFGQFCEKYEISKRETEIIHEICKGLTNQQIADKLFISLQTVKDHTHRIYTKTDCTSRAQLIRMVNESI